MTLELLLSRVAVGLGFISLFILGASAYSLLLVYPNWFEFLYGTGFGVFVAHLFVRMFASSQKLRDLVIAGSWK